MDCEKGKIAGSQNGNQVPATKVEGGSNAKSVSPSTTVVGKKFTRTESLANIRCLIDNVAKGDLDTEEALSRLGFGIRKEQLEQTSDSVVCECLNKDSCGYVSDKVFEKCPECGGPSASIVIESKPLSDDEYVRSIVPEVVVPVGYADPVINMYLAYLRPQDKFIFTHRIPKGLEKGKEYTVIPADRGFIAFSDNRSGVNKMRLSHALLFEVKLLSDIISAPRHERKCHVGDRVRHVTSNREGKVVEDGPICSIKFEDDGAPIYEQIPQQYLTVVRKTQTTRDYVRFDGADYYVQVADFCSDPLPTLKEALVFLYGYNRLAFNRYSKYLSEKSPTSGVDPFHLTEECLELLKDIDPNIWSNPQSPKPIRKRLWKFNRYNKKDKEVPGATQGT